MAIRKFRKIMKPFTVVISLVFVLSLAYGGIESFRTSRENKKAQEALKLNGNVISKVEIERLKNEISSQYSSRNIQIDKSLIDVIAFNQIIDKNLTLEIAKKLKIKVPSSEVEQQFKQVEDSIGDKNQFKRMLEFRGYSKDSYKAQIKEQLLLVKTIDSFSDEIIPTEEEIQNYYNTHINDRNIDIASVKNEITEEIKRVNGFKKYNESLFQARKNMKIKEISKEYEDLLEHTLYEEKGFEISNLDFALQVIYDTLKGNTKNNADIEKLAKTSISRKIKIAEVAKKEGIEVSENLGTIKKLDEYQNELINKYRTKINPTREELKVFFNKFNDKYDIKASADVNFAFINIKASKEDETLAQKKAEEVLKNVTPKNFKEYGNSLSKEEGYLYEDLGTFTKGRMVKEFEEGISKIEPNSIGKKVIKTVFGYHIVYVKENDEKEGKWKAEHILVRVIPSEKTIQEKIEKINKIKNDLNSGIASFDEIQKLDDSIIQSTLIKGVTPDGIIPNLGYNVKIAKKIYEAPLNQVILENNDSGMFLFQKVKEIKPEKADFDKAYNIIRNDYIENEIIKYLKNI